MEDIFRSLSDALVLGITYDDFESYLFEELTSRGWWGRDDKAGDEKYLKWRLKTIFRTNLSTSYSSGRYRQQVKVTDTRPIWVYSAVMDNRTRLKHRDLNGKAFRFDNPFWKSFYPPNGWNCRCGVYTLSEDGARNRGIEILDDIPDYCNSSDFCSPEWKYNPGEEKLTPSWEKYKFIEAIKTSTGESLLDVLKREYEDDIKEYN